MEVHHVKPLQTLKGDEQPFDPRTDLLPVCSNCHRMIHRKPDYVLSIDEMRKIVNNKL
nr:HNH endonuclease [Bacillus sp. FJAT-29814]